MNPNVKSTIKDYSEMLISKDEGGGKALAVKENQMMLLCEISRLMKMEDDNLTISQIADKLENAKKHPLQDDRAEIISVISTIEDYNFRRPTNTTKKLLKNALCAALVIRKESLENYRNNPASDIYKLSSEDLQDREIVIAGERKNFIENVKFGKQRSAAALGSGFFYEIDGRYFVITAAHVIFPSLLNLPLSEVRFVSKYLVREQSYLGLKAHTFNHSITFPKTNVFKPVDKELRFEKDYKLSSGGDDWAIIEIEPESGEDDDYNNINYLTRKDLFENKLQYIEGGGNQAAYGLGHGFGLPLKLSACGEIINESLKDNTTEQFECEMDFFSGNSGCGVYDALTHKLVGMLIRGKKDIYFESDKDSKNPNENPSKKELLIPGVLSDSHAGEVCQNIEFIKNYEPIDRDIENSSLEIPYRELLPLSYLMKGDSDGIYHLDIVMYNRKEKNSVNFSIYPSKEGNITIIEIILSENATTDKQIHEASYIIKGPNIKNLNITQETIEIRVFDKPTERYHEAIVEFIDSKENKETPKNKKLFWTSCRTKEFYAKGSNKVGIAMGYFENETFKSTDIKGFDSSELTINNQRPSITLGINAKTGKIEKETNKNKKNLIPGRKLIISSANNGDIKKSPPLSGRNPKPTKFIY